MAIFGDKPRGPIVRNSVEVKQSPEEQQRWERVRQHFNRVAAMPQFQNKAIAVNARGLVASGNDWDELYAELEKKHVNHGKLLVGIVMPPAPEIVRQTQRVDGPSEPQV